MAGMAVTITVRLAPFAKAREHGFRSRLCMAELLPKKCEFSMNLCTKCTNGDMIIVSYIEMRDSYAGSRDFSRQC